MLYEVITKNQDKQEAEVSESELVFEDDNLKLVISSKGMGIIQIA